MTVNINTRMWTYIFKVKQKKHFLQLLSIKILRINKTQNINGYKTLILCLRYQTNFVLFFKIKIMYSVNNSVQNCTDRWNMK